MKTLITHPNFSYMGEELKEKNPDLHIADFSMGEFKDTWPRIFSNNPKSDIRHQEIVYIGDYSIPHNLFTNLCTVAGLSTYVAGKVNVIVPYFPVGTNERITKEGEIPTAKVMAGLIGNIPMGSKGKPSIHVFDIHDLRENFYFDEHKVNVELNTAMDLIKAQISPDAVIVFPDEGAKKRFGNEFKDREVVFCSKKRDGDKRIITVNSDVELTGRNMLIVDDLISSGGTVLKAAEELRRLGASSVSAFATHGVFTGDSHQTLGGELDMLYTTDTIPQNISRANEVQNMSVLSISEIIQKKILQLL